MRLAYAQVTSPCGLYPAVYMEVWLENKQGRWGRTPGRFLRYQVESSESDTTMDFVRTLNGCFVYNQPFKRFLYIRIKIVVTQTHCQENAKLSP